MRRLPLFVLSVLLAPAFVRADQILLPPSLSLQLEQQIQELGVREFALAPPNAALTPAPIGAATLQGERPRSATKAVALSLLLPGAGQFYTEQGTAARAFVGTEVALWTGVLAFRTYGRLKKEDYVGFATEHAGIQSTGKDDNFYKFLTFYDNRDEYNKISRIFEPSNPFYPETNQWNWQWDSRESRTRYRELRNASKTAYRRAVYLIGGAVANRLLSAVHAYRAVKQYNRKLRQEKGNLEIGLSRFRFQKPLGFRLTVTKAF